MGLEIMWRIGVVGVIFYDRTWRNFAFPGHQFARQQNGLGTSTFAVNHILCRQGIVHLGQERLAHAGTLLVDGVFEWVSCISNALLRLVAQLVATTQCLVDPTQFITMVKQVLEKDALGVAQKQEVDRLDQRAHLNLHVAIVGQDDAPVAGDDHAAGSMLPMQGNDVSIGCLNAFIDVDDIARVGAEWQVVIFKNLHVI